MRVSKASEERRQEILDAAMRVFYEKGYEKTSISDIALKLGVAQGLIYRRHFLTGRWKIMPDGWLSRWGKRSGTVGQRCGKRL